MGIVHLVKRRLNSVSDEELKEVKRMVSFEEVRRIKEKIDALEKLK